MTTSTSSRWYAKQHDQNYCLPGRNSFRSKGHAYAGRTFATKGELARHFVLRALASPLPIAWVTADSAYGQESRFRRLLEQSGVGYVLAVPKAQFSAGSPRVDGLFPQAPDEAW
ncbi:transposase [Streptomyces sp. NPDC127033]|uniref:transposase n=1 Tax=Streptomyces sp. NPDC127033 TaxID=3347110 RepID=UPI00366947F1